MPRTNKRQLRHMAAALRPVPLIAIAALWLATGTTGEFEAPDTVWLAIDADRDTSLGWRAVSATPGGIELQFAGIKSDRKPGAPLEHVTIANRRGSAARIEDESAYLFSGETKYVDGVEWRRFDVERSPTAQAMADLAPVDPSAYTIREEDQGGLVRVRRDSANAGDLRTRIQPGGRLSFRRGGQWVLGSLRELRGHLRDERLRFEVEEKAQGRSGREEMSQWRDWSPSRLRVHLDMNPDAPCLHLFFIMNVLAEEGFDKLVVSVGPRCVRLVLPRSVSHGPEQPLFQAGVKVRAPGSVEVVRGGVRIRRPTSVTFLIRGVGETQLVRDVARRIDRVIRAAGAAGKGPLVTSSLAASYGAPVSSIMDVLEVFLEAGIDVVGIRNSKLPTKAERDSREFPYPNPIK